MPIDPIAFINATSACVEALSILAAPILFTRHRKDAERRRTTFDAGSRLAPFLAHLPKHLDDPKLLQLASDVAQIQSMLAELASPHDVDRAISEAARAALERFGFPTPPRGWDRYAGG
jgi:hypothetical protein